MTVQQAEAILVDLGIAIAYQHRFCGDKGTVLRLDNYAMINIFDDGRYYVQGKEISEIVEAFGRIERPWDPSTYIPEPVLPWLPPPTPPKRFDF